jgi:hypothetical protein
MSEDLFSSSVKLPELTTSQFTIYLVATY